MADILDEPLLPPEERPSLDIQDIMELLPHRYPFLLVDRVEWSRASKRSAIGYKGITYNEEYFQGHFPKMPVMPGVLQLEAITSEAEHDACLARGACTAYMHSANQALTVCHKREQAIILSGREHCEHLLAHDEH